MFAVDAKATVAAEVPEVPPAELGSCTLEEEGSPELDGDESDEQATKKGIATNAGTSESFLIEPQ